MRCFLLGLWLVSTTWLQAQTYITRQQALDDISFYNESLRQVHANPFLHIDEAGYRNQVDRITAAFPDSIELKEFLVQCHRITALLDDGHTSPALVQRAIVDDLRKPLFVPIAFAGDSQHVYVMQSKTDLVPRGAEIISINGTNLQRFWLQTRSWRGGLPAYRSVMASLLLGYHLALTGIRPPFHIQYREGNQAPRQVSIPEGINFTNCLLLAMPQLTGPAYSFHLADDHTGWLDFNRMEGDYTLLANYLDSCFAVMRAKKVSRLIVDLRKNSGGNSLLGDLLIGYLTRKKYRMSTARSWKVSQQYKDYLRTGGDSSHVYLQQPTGTIWRWEDCQPEDPKFIVDTLFEGKTYFLTGPFTYSSAMMLADAASRYQLAIVAGEPCGEAINDFGEVMTLTLPNSRLVVQVTTALDTGTDCGSANYTQVVMPDILIRTTINDLLMGRDPVAAYLLKKGTK